MTDMPDPVKVAHYRPCGGCGAASPDQRCIGCSHEFGGARAMQAAMPAPAGVRVRKLEWDGPLAATPFCVYSVGETVGDLWTWTRTEYPYGQPSDPLPTEEAAKAAAQADYEARILSALIAKTEPPQ